MRLLLQLAEESSLRARIDAMFHGEKINITEKRAVLHVALRAPHDQSIVVDGKNVVPEVHAVLERMADFSNRARGGSGPGPGMAYEALKRDSEPSMTFRFVSNVEGTDFAAAAQFLDPAETLL